MGAEAALKSAIGRR